VRSIDRDSWGDDFVDTTRRFFERSLGDGSHNPAWMELSPA
jgi:hypothetical protein